MSFVLDKKRFKSLLGILVWICLNFDHFFGSLVLIAPKNYVIVLTIYEILDEILAGYGYPVKLPGLDWSEIYKKRSFL